MLEATENCLKPSDDSVNGEGRRWHMNRGPARQGFEEQEHVSDQYMLVPLS